jgi:uncharacterized protein
MSASSPATGRPPLPGDDGRHRLSERAVPYWRIKNALGFVPVAIVVTVVLVLVDVPTAVTVAASALSWILAVVMIAVAPPIARRIWWYAIGDEEVDLHEGLIVTTRTVVPMVRVQHVDLHRGPLSTRMGLAEIELHTAAGSVTIPALDHAEAERIRARVSVLARVPDEL